MLKFHALQYMHIFYSMNKYISAWIRYNTILQLTACINVWKVNSKEFKTQLYVYSADVFSSCSYREIACVQLVKNTIQCKFWLIIGWITLLNIRTSVASSTKTSPGWQSWQDLSKILSRSRHDLAMIMPWLFLDKILWRSYRIVQDLVRSWPDAQLTWGSSCNIALPCSNYSICSTTTSKI